MSNFEVKGWCPGALKPMMSGDGLVVRVRPRLGCLTSAQARGIAEAARTFGNSIIDLSSRANLQLRGVSPERHGALLDVLGGLNLVDARDDIEARRNIVVTPFWDGAGAVARIAAALEAALADCDLPLPGKFGFAVDCGDERVLAQVSADIRFERSSVGGLLVRADGAARGIAVSEADAVETALQMARWFVESGGVSDGRGRMARHLATGVLLPASLAGSDAPSVGVPVPRPGLSDGGALVGVAFGSMHADQLEALGQLDLDLRMTPWRMVFLSGAEHLPEDPEFVVDARDPILRVEACPGAPLCPQAVSETRPLGRQLARLVPQGDVLHVSGCAKGCACQRPAAVTLVATDEGFDLVRNGTAQSLPEMRGLRADALVGVVSKFFGGGDGLHV